MIKLLSLLLSVTLLNGQNFVYLLPDDIASYETWLQSRIKKSDQPIQIITPSMHYPALHKSFVAHQAHGIQCSMIVHALDHDSLRLIQYQETYLYHYRSRPMEGSWIVLDSYACHMSAPLDEEVLQRSASTVWCSNDPYVVARAKSLFNRMQKRSHPYLK